VTKGLSKWYWIERKTGKKIWKRGKKSKCQEDKKMQSLEKG
jgi:hypothetical protein